MPGNHSYVWSDLEGVGDGTTGSFGSGVHHSENGPTTDACFFIEGSRGIEKQMMQYMHIIRDKYLYVPFLNDCHSKVDIVIDHFGLPNPNAPGRFDALPPPGRYIR
jgi:hypothetical protein